MRPPWDPELEFSDKRSTHAEKAKDEDGEDGRTVSGVDELVVQTADVAGIAHVQDVDEKLALAAAWATAGQPCDQWGNGLSGILQGDLDFCIVEPGASAAPGWDIQSLRAPRFK